MFESMCDNCPLGPTLKMMDGIAELLSSDSEKSERVSGVAKAHRMRLGYVAAREGCIGPKWMDQVCGLDSHATINSDLIANINYAITGE